MKSLPVGEIKAQFSEVLEKVQMGRIIRYSLRQKEKAGCQDRSHGRTNKEKEAEVRDSRWEGKDYLCRGFQDV